MVLVSSVILAQNLPVVSGQYQNKPTLDVIHDFESQTGYLFYYQLQWFDSLFTTATFQNTPLNEALDIVFQYTPLNYHPDKEQIILTYNVKIITSPEIGRSVSKHPVDGSVEKGLIFEREYLGSAGANKGIEDQVFEIGNRNLMVTGERATLAGYIREKQTGNPIEGAFVFAEGSSASTISDENGFYSLTLPNGKEKVIVQYVSMKATSRRIVLFSSGQLNIDMEEDIIALMEVTINADRDQNVKSTQMGMAKISAKDTRNMPVVLGEKDIMKVATTMPGVQTVGEGASGYNVRGGKSDQNLIQLNGANIYNPAHFFGFFSIFNSDAIDNMEIYKSSVPVQYDSRLSSVFDIQSKKANTEKFVGVGGISPITSKLNLEIPIIKDKAGLMVGGRTTYSNWVLKKVNNANFRENKVSFADFNLRYDHEFNRDNFLTVSGYFSKDKFRLPSDTLFSFSEFSFTNANGSVSWNKRFNDKLNGKLSAIGSSYGYNLLYDESEYNAFKQDFGLKEYTLRSDMNFYPSEEHEIQFGLISKYYHINPGHRYPNDASSLIIPQKTEDDFGLENALYISDQYELGPNISIYGGLRYNLFSRIGPGSMYGYTEGSPRNAVSLTDTTTYSPGQFIKSYHGLEPRLSARYSLDDQASIKVGFSRSRQNIHALSNSASLSPTDIWRLSGPHLLPQIADQLSAGYFKNILSKQLEASVEVYYKKVKNLVDFKTGAEFLLNNAVETAILQGPGKSYGVELMVKKSGKLNGWLNYTYARTFIQLDGNYPEEIVNNGLFFPTNYDKPHALNMVANYKFTHRVSMSTNFTFNSGRPVTYPVASYDFKGIQIVHYSDRNAYRIPDYIRMDIGINIEEAHKIEKLAHSYWSFSIYNLLGRQNPYSVFFDIKKGIVNGYQLIIFGTPIPTISYNFRF